MRSRYRLFAPSPLWGISLSSSQQLDITSLKGPWYKPTPQIQCEIVSASDSAPFPDPQAISFIAKSLQQRVQSHSRRKKPKVIAAVPSAQVISQSHRLQDLSLCAETPEARQAQAAYIHQLALQHWPSDAIDMALDYRCSPVQSDQTVIIEWVACHQKWIQAWDKTIIQAGLSPYRIEPEHQAWWRVLRAGEAAELANSSCSTSALDAQSTSHAHSTSHVQSPSALMASPFTHHPDSSITSNSSEISNNNSSTIPHTPAVMALLCCEHDQLILTVWLGPHCLYRHHNSLTADATSAERLETLAQHLQRARVSIGVTHWSRCYLSSDLPFEEANITWLEATTGLTLLPLPFGLEGMATLTAWGLALAEMAAHA
ncbi:hypothetical protein BFW38_12465 [Terasakiispira papahanaumokuakeensis]|uniref:Uncharacterized protein n=1 Tax=Terasakiispira papahanaumokuakeensis TaxID=197479 RepID=A0A1E2VBI0_9GAMM|nr:hypothetical protein [Terasakiispira papahanaumokuakeensis]ODC04222.1 hypothetical protein BFW38_12465 [Terasakiispira papahanaumokuakeensis]